MNSQDMHGWLDADTTPPTGQPKVSIPQRDVVISIDDVIAVHILLHTTKSVQEFLERI